MRHLRRGIKNNSKAIEKVFVLKSYNKCRENFFVSQYKIVMLFYECFFFNKFVYINDTNSKSVETRS